MGPARRCPCEAPNRAFSHGRQRLSCCFRGRDLDKGDQAAEEIDGARRTTGNVQIDGDHLIDGADHGIAALEYAAAATAITHGDDPFRIRRRRIGAFERHLHVASHGTGDEQHIGVARGGDESQTEPLDVVDRIVDGVDFAFTAWRCVRVPP
jgi:hypothetical protein